MSIDIRMLLDSDEKQRCARQVLEDLKIWFANEPNREDYIKKCGELPLWAAFDTGDNCVGFFAGTTHYGHVGEIVVCGVMQSAHGKGVGKAIFTQMERYYKELGCDIMLVKTLSDIVDDADYAATRKFYESVGFVPLITLTEMWDEQNPCLIMIKNLMGEQL